MIKNYKYSIAFIGIISLLTLFFILQKDKKESVNEKKIVTLSTFILYDVASHITEDTFELVKIIPSGVDIHSFEPTPKIMAKVERSDLLFLNGAGLESWLGLVKAKNKRVSIADYIQLEHLDEKEHEDEAHHDTCSDSKLDPHFWLDIENMKRAVDIMTYEFISLEPKHKFLYLRNRDKYIKTLEEIDSSYVKGLGECALNTIITNHNAFSYLSAKYNFNVSSLKGLSPDSQPSPKDMIRIMDTIHKHKVPVIFFEDFSSSKSMQGLAKQLNVGIDSLHTLENVTRDDVRMNSSYEDIMLQNLNKLRGALLCQ